LANRDYEGRFVGGQIRSQKRTSDFWRSARNRHELRIAWFPNDARAQFASSLTAELAQERLPSGARSTDFVLEWEDPTPWSKDLRLLGYKYEKHGRDRALNNVMPVIQTESAG
jgi:hypothetical protein